MEGQGSKFTTEQGCWPHWRRWEGQGTEKPAWVVCDFEGYYGLQEIRNTDLAKMPMSWGIVSSSSRSVISRPKVGGQAVLKTTEEW